MADEFMTHSLLVFLISALLIVGLSTFVCYPLSRLFKDLRRARRHRCSTAEAARGASSA